MFCKVQDSVGVYGVKGIVVSDSGADAGDEATEESDTSRESRWGRECITSFGVRAGREKPSEEENLDTRESEKMVSVSVPKLAILARQVEQLRRTTWKWLKGCKWRRFGQEASPKATGLRLASSGKRGQRYNEGGCGGGAIPPFAFGKRHCGRGRRSWSVDGEHRAR